MTDCKNMITDLKDLASKTVKYADEVDDDVCILFTDGTMVRLSTDGTESVGTSSQPLSRYLIGRGGERERKAAIGFGLCTAEEWEAGIAEIAQRRLDMKKTQLEQLKKELGET